LSKTIARNVRKILQATWFKQLFTTRIAKGHASVSDFGTNSGGGVFVASFGGGITGRRADVVIVDDPHDIGDKLEQIEKTIESFNTVLLSRLNNRKTGRVLVVAHRVHERDLSASLLHKKKWRHVLLPLIATRDQTYRVAKGNWFRRKGELLRPDAFGPDDIDELRESSFHPDFEMLYQQNFDLQALPAIRADHFGTFAEPPFGPVVLSVDAGMTNRSRSAFSVIQAWSLAGDRYYLLDQFREQIDYSELCIALGRFRRSYRPAVILIERAANGFALISQLSRKYPKLLMPIDPDGRNKSARLRVHADTIIGNRIWLPAHASWRDDFIKEFVEFPNGKFTDQVDATTQFLDHAGEFAGLEPNPQAGGVVALYGNGQSRSFSPSNARGRGIAQGVRGNGQPLVEDRPNRPVFQIKTEVKY
jgi:predicted phage terminase large subunit-like protein